MDDYSEEFMKNLQKYYPLLSLVTVALLGALALTLGKGTDKISFMSYFMGLLLSQFSMLKLFNVSQFASGFRKYDLVASKFQPYAYLYPFLELFLGLAYLSSVWPVVTNLITIGITTVGALGVFRSLKSGLDLRCACMGTVLDVPLSTVTLTEDIGMGLMALFMLKDCF
jgi:hypothetical protein